MENAEAEEREGKSLNRFPNTFYFRGNPLHKREAVRDQLYSYFSRTERKITRRLTESISKLKWSVAGEIPDPVHDDQLRYGFHSGLTISATISAGNRFGLGPDRERCNGYDKA